MTGEWITGEKDRVDRTTSVVPRRLNHIMHRNSVQLGGRLRAASSLYTMFATRRDFSYHRVITRSHVYRGIPSPAQQQQQNCIHHILIGKGGVQRAYMLENNLMR